MFNTYIRIFLSPTTTTKLILSNIFFTMITIQSLFFTSIDNEWYPTC